MVLVQIELPRDIDKEIKQYMLDNNIIDKRVAIVEILTKYKNDRKK